MRQQKIRGNKRRQRYIEEWRLENLKLRFDLIEKYDSGHIDIVVHPWCDISIVNSEIPEPRGVIKQLMLSGLIDIYDTWKEQLDKLGQPYYLKLWLFTTRFSKSQVVCATGDKIKYYENVFFKPDKDKILALDNFGTLKARLAKLTWDYHLDEDHYDDSTVGEPELYASRQEYLDTQTWFTRLLKKPHRIEEVQEQIDDNHRTGLYSFKRGDLWIGGQI
ncbi:MAG: hypothetical protein EOP45_04850 [Sphingobacteriaceae bacterium]|nr:MAG: hypothetical protein EOP45_04850 [Sphingobacteriaceae bacterium]